MDKKDLQAILNYVHSGKKVNIKLTGANGCYTLLDIDGVEAFSDVTVLLCHDESINFEKGE